MDYLQAFRDGVGLPLWFLLWVEVTRYLAHSLAIMYFSAVIPEFMGVTEIAKGLRGLVYWLHGMGIASTIIYGCLVAIKVMAMLTLGLMSLGITVPTL